MKVGDLFADVSKVCSVLHTHKVEYLVIGGTAVAFHGFYRMTLISPGVPAEKHDLDFWYNPTYPNYFRLLDALEELGMDVVAYKNEQSPDPHKSFFRYEFDYFTIDFLPTVVGHSRFLNSYRNKEEIDLDGTPIFVISAKDLIINKEASGRLKDKDDLDFLRKVEESGI
jgi:hypothetical protein